MNFDSRRYAYFLSLVLIGLLSHFLGAITFAGASVNTPTIYTEDSNPYGKSYAEWTGEWWKWFVSMPNDESHPLNDASGAECHRNQQGPVFFLLGGSKLPVDRTCAIPYGKAILLPTITNECSNAEFPNLKTESELRNCAVTNADFFENMKGAIDGVPITDIEQYTVVSPLFNMTFPEDKPMFSARPGISDAVSTGNWIFIDDLPLGPHEIYFKGDSIDYREHATQNFAQEGTYHLNITSVPNP